MSERERNRRPELIPAIDVRGGHAVRLLRGDYDEETVYDADPSDAARRWAEQGARFLHVVDLDGAREGRPVNLEHVRRIADAVDVPVQVGGGLRDAEAVRDAIAAGAERVVLGTALQRDPGLARTLVAEHGDAFVAAVDARDGEVAVSGWTEGTGVEVADLVAGLAKCGVRRFLYTPVEVDGTLAGPGVERLRVVAGAVEGELIYSGGVGSLDDLRALAKLDIPSVTGVIVGRALYEGRFTVTEGEAALRG
ncbi:MAG TPA: 1-(5-phosphoribosyl)-5-[(5-phosphoribosylamino)methylideneamino]imidazole-4-carboxamide isomerase [Solirubrobacterales bacterium]|nr:1-(5-phosphoribosyl)-5-[(5-phosphoribosylamino)methylideneamino]imidazole-4-carboxamide isomerase [Solirubrobacterales bacterium]